MSFSPWFSFPLCCCLSLTLCLVSALKRTRVSHSCRVYIDPCVFELFTLITTNVEREDGEKNPLLQMKAIILLIFFRGSPRNHIQQTLVYHSAGFIEEFSPPYFHKLKSPNPPYNQICVYSTKTQKN